MKTYGKGQARYGGSADRENIPGEDEGGEKPLRKGRDGGKTSGESAGKPHGEGAEAGSRCGECTWGKTQWKKCPWKCSKNHPGGKAAQRQEVSSAETGRNDFHLCV